ncbi:RNI-like protein [Linnemannia elongata AG-77]|uniref:RNI-like protein n=1 Tax=Linnemannia elongata AG-77 TaxID=1314771 RepID=A0A197JF14_9FUNG|nr:RNI-like protein [Linnemannia elongata AG-77]
MSVNPLDIPEILQWILNCRQILDQEDLFSASLVNKAWYQVSKRAQWIKLELDSDSWVDPYHQALAAQLSMYGAFVRTLVLKECVADRSQLEAILPYMTCLQSIMVGRVTLYNRSSSLLQSLELLPMAHLQHLCLPHVSTASGRIDLLLRICESQTHQIMHLELLDSEIDDDVLADIARTCPSLKTLDLSRNEVIAFKGALDSSESDTMDDSQQNWTARAAAVSTQWASNRSNNNKNNSPYSQRQVVLQHDDTFDADDTLGVLLNEESKQQQTQTYHQQDQQNKQQYQTQQQDHTLTSTRPTQSPLPRLCPPSKLLREDPPFMHLEELSLVFCFGIANTEFQTLFRSFRNKSLRSLNLQFTNIEDSGLEALAQNMGHRLTSVSVSYCNRITARGIRALVEPNRCPRLLELEFLSCDFVSADCFRDPWGCHRLRRLEFTGSRSRSRGAVPAAAATPGPATATDGTECVNGSTAG